MGIMVIPSMPFPISVRNGGTGYFSAKYFGAKGDGVKVLDAVTASGSPTVTSVASSFTASDVGKAVTLYSGAHQNFTCSFTQGDATVTASSTANLVVGMRISAYKTVETEGDLTEDGMTISNLGTVSGLLPGMVVSGNGIEGGTLIVSVGASSCAISVASNRTATDVFLYFSKHVVDLDATILSVTNGTTFEISVNATDTISTAGDFVPGYIQTAIIAVNGPTSITLSDNAEATCAGSDMIYGTDDTASINAALAACFSAGGKVLQFDDGMYVICGPLLDTGVRNSVILIPNGSGSMKSLTIMGTSIPSFEANGFLPDYEPSNSGAVFFCSTRPNGTNPCMFSGNSSLGLSYTTVKFEKITFRRPQWSLLGEMNFHNGGALIVDQCVIEPDYRTVGEFLKHTYPNSQTSIAFPNSNNGCFCNFTNSRILGSGTAISGAQHTNIVNAEFGACRIAIANTSTEGGTIRATNVHMVGCGFNFCVPTGTKIVTFLVGGGILENQGYGPFINFWDFFDEGGTAMQGKADVSLLTSNQARVSTAFTQVTYLSDTYRETVNPIPVKS